MGKQKKFVKVSEEELVHALMDILEHADGDEFCYMAGVITNTFIEKDPDTDTYTITPSIDYCGVLDNLLKGKHK